MIIIIPSYIDLNQQISRVDLKIIAPQANTDIKSINHQLDNSDENDLIETLFTNHR